ncbi:MAG: hypothetical protein QNJ98_10800 [Planctomycetota bacterium]|nr:hypothetical protein [Planctomycetota bacterium]
MRGRQVCWSDPKLQELAKKFVPATDEVWRLHNRKELDCLFFQGFCEEGHYGGRSKPTTTRQGIYCCTPSGQFLASVNTVDPRRMARMLEQALAKWAEVPESERYLDYDPKTRAGEIRRLEQRYPADGLPLRVYTRDMPRTDLPDDWRKAAWNVDSLWYQKTEARSLLPKKLKKGATHAWPERLVQRLARHNLVDNVRGQTNGFRAKHVKVGEITTTVLTLDEDRVTVRFEGRSETTTTGTWPEKGKVAGVDGFDTFARGVRTTLRGEATWSRSKARFLRFELAAEGTRWGRTRYNFRQDDVDEAPIGFAIVLDENDPGRRVAPAEVWHYGW